MCHPDSRTTTTTTTARMEEISLKIFWEQVHLTSFDRDSSKGVYVRGKQVRAGQVTYGSVRMFALSTFLSVLIDELPEYKTEKCESCSTKSVVNNSLKACSRCHCVHYCSRECHVKHFPSHKKECKAVWKELYGQYSSDCIKTDSLTLHMSLKAFMFPNLKDRVLTPLLQFTEAKVRAILDNRELRANPNQIREFRSDL